MSKHIDRRNFLGVTAAGIAAASAGAAAAQTLTQGSIDGRPIRFGFVGVGDRGSHHLDAALGIDGVEVPAICDIDDAYLHRAKRWVEESGKPSPKLYGKTKTDFERMCAEEELDCVICSTSWRWHTPVLLAAMRNGKHAVSEVPIALTLDEAWEIVETWEKTGKWGTLGLEGFRSLTVANMVWEGLLGDVTAVSGLCSGRYAQSTTPYPLHPGFPSALSSIATPYTLSYLSPHYSSLSPTALPNSECLNSYR